MESRRQLDITGSSTAAKHVAPALIFLTLLSWWFTLTGFAQIPSQNDGPERIRALYEQQRWDRLVGEVESGSADEGDVYYYYGFALAQLGRWDEARAALIAGRVLLPNDERFPIELAGIEFKQKRYSEAARWLRVGLKLNPADSYANDFLGTIYFLQDNLEAALKYWNRIDRPRVENVRIPPGLHVDPVLLDRAFAFSPASTMRVRELITSKTRVEGLGIFPTYRFELEARDDGRFDVAFNASERNGWGSGTWETLLAASRGLFYETVYLDYYNLNQSAINVSSLVRWDAQKRRLAVSLSGPPHGNPKYRYKAGFDLRDEEWDLHNSEGGSMSAPGTLDLAREALGGEFRSFAGGAWDWSLGAELSHRTYKNIAVDSAIPPILLMKGFELKQLAEAKVELARLPERRLESHAVISSEAGTIWSSPAHSFLKLQASISGLWHPQMRGEDYAAKGKICAGKTIGDIPFDELFMLGMERDNELWMRGHVGTRNGRKGSAPLGRNYILMNWEVDKIIIDNGLISVKLSPFLDIGRITDHSNELGSHKWLWDTGIQMKFRLLGAPFVFIYGKGLQSGTNAFYFTSRQ